MKSLNRVMLMGHLAADPEERQTASGVALCTFALATNRFSKDENGEKREIADFHRVVAWRKLGEICKEYLVKGSLVLVEGRIINNSFDDKDGKRQYKTEIVADGVNILSWRKAKSGEAEIDVKSVKEEETVDESVNEEDLVAA